MTDVHKFGEGRGHVAPHVAKAITRIAAQNGVRFFAEGGHYWFEARDAGVAAISRQKLKEAGVWALLVSATERVNRLKRSYR